MRNTTEITKLRDRPRESSRPSLDSYQYTLHRYREDRFSETPTADDIKVLDGPTTL